MQSQQFFAQQIFQAPTDQEIEQCCLLLRKTYMAKDDQERVQAEEALNQISKNSQKFLEIFYGIEIEDKTKQSAATYTNHLLKSQAVREHLSPQQKLLQMNIIYQAMITEGLPLTLRLHLGTTLKSILETELGDEFKTLLLPIIVESLTLTNSGAVGALVALQCLTNSTTHGERLAKVFQDTARNMILLADQWIDPLLMELSALGMSLANSTQEQIDLKVSKIIERLEALRVWTETLRNFVGKLGDKIGDLLKHIIVHDAIALLLVKFLCLHIQSPNQITDIIISTSGIKKFDDLLNEIKIRVMRILNRLMVFMLDKKAELPTISTSKFYSIIQSVLQLCLTTILKFCKSDTIDLSKAVADTTYECFLSEILFFLTRLTNQPENYYLFAEYRRDLVLHVLFPLLRTMESEQELLLDNPSQFVQLAIDTCEEQKSQTVKTNCAAFMEALCDRIDGTASLVVMFALSLIEFSLESDRLEDIPTKFLTLKDCLQSPMLTKTKANIRVETSLIVLNCLSYIVSGRKDLLYRKIYLHLLTIVRALLEKMVTQYKQFFFSTKDVLIKSRFVMLIGFYYEWIFKNANQKEEFAAITIFLISAIGCVEEGQEAVSLQAIDGITAIIRSEEVAVRIEPYAVDVLEKLTEFVGLVPYHELFDVLLDYVRNYVDKLIDKPKTIINLVKILVTRIESELLKLQGTKELTNLTINKAWNIIRAIGEEKKYFPALQQELEEALLPVIKYIEFPEKIDFDEDIIFFLNSSMAYSERVSPITFTMTQTFPKIFAKYRCCLGGFLFQCINHILVYGKEDIKKVPTVLDLIIDLACEAMKTNSKFPNEANRSDGALLIHVVFQYYGDVLEPKQRNVMLMSALEVLNAGVKKGFFRARLYGIILHGFMTNYQATEEFLVSHNVLAQVVRQTLENISDFKMNYDKKVFVIGFSYVLMQEKLNEGVTTNITLIFDSVITMLKIIQALEQASAARKIAAQEFKTTKNKAIYSKTEEDIPDDEEITKRILSDAKGESKEIIPNPQNRTTFDEDLEDEDDDDSDNENDPLSACGEEDEQRVSVDLLITYFKKRDEFSFFRDVIVKIKEVNHDGLAQIVAKLPLAKQNYLKQVLQSYRVPVDEKNQATRARKIVTVKGKKDKSAFPDKDNEMSDK